MRRVAIVLAGGSGGRKTLLVQTLDRVQPVFGEENTYVIAGRDLESPILETFPSLNSRLFAEPERRKTAGAIVWGIALLSILLDEDDLSFGIFPSDHVASDAKAFETDARLALDASEQTNELVTIGIQPNSGLLFCRLHTFESEIRSYCVEHAIIYDEIRARLREGNTHLARNAFAKLPSITIEQALLERSHALRVLEARFAWDDLQYSDGPSTMVPGAKEGNVTF